MRFKYDTERLDEKEVANLMAPYALKFKWFIDKEYVPHYYQLLFHSDTNENQLTRFRNIVAGRRGGKTMSAAWEILYYALHPEEFHWDAHKTKKTRPLHIWVLTQNHIIGRQPLLTFRDIIKQAGLENGIHFKENRANKFFEFENGSLVEFKTAEEPERLRGAGLDILWIDEAAVIPDSRAFEVVRPALSDQLGLVVATTTPLGKNWYYDQFWGEESITDPNVGSVEYRSIDNPHFPAQEWLYIQKTYHPLLFKQEYMASFDSMAGKELPGDWLQFYQSDDLPKRPDGKLDLRIFIGIDPAVSLSDKADRFAAAVIGVTNEGDQGYLLDTYVDRIPFPDQVDLIQKLYHTWHPQTIAIEDQAFQKALIQQASRIEGLPPIQGIPARGKKFERILSMSPLFRLGKIKIKREHFEFINEWIDYDSELKNPKDDCLDAVEIALRGAGVLLPTPIEIGTYRPTNAAYTLEELVERDLPKLQEDFDDPDDDYYDEHVGIFW